MIPSDDIEKYLANYVINRGPEGNASFAHRLLKKIKSSSQRLSVPCSLEYTSALNKTPIKLTVSCPANEVVSAEIFPSSSGAELAFQLANNLKLTSSAGFGVSLNGVFLGDKEILMDALAAHEAEGRDPASVSLVFHKQLYMPSEPRSSQGNTFVCQQVGCQLHFRVFFFFFLIPN